MGIEISRKDGPVLGIYSSLDMFKKLKLESQRLEQEWHPYDAFNFLVTAWHLFEEPLAEINFLKLICGTIDEKLQLC